MKAIKWFISSLIAVVPISVYAWYFLFVIENKREWLDIIVVTFFGYCIIYLFITKASHFDKWFDSKLK